MMGRLMVVGGIVVAVGAAAAAWFLLGGAVDPDRAHRGDIAQALFVEGPNSGIVHDGLLYAVGTFDDVEGVHLFDPRTGEHMHSLASNAWRAPLVAAEGVGVIDIGTRSHVYQAQDGRVVRRDSLSFTLEGNVGKDCFVSEAVLRRQWLAVLCEYEGELGNFLIVYSELLDDLTGGAFGKPYAVLTKPRDGLFDLALPDRGPVVAGRLPPAEAGGRPFKGVLALEPGPDARERATVLYDADGASGMLHVASAGPLLVIGHAQRVQLTGPRGAAAELPPPPGAADDAHLIDLAMAPSGAYLLAQYAWTGGDGEDVQRVAVFARSDGAHPSDPDAYAYAGALGAPEDKWADIRHIVVGEGFAVLRVEGGLSVFDLSMLGG